MRFKTSTVFLLLVGIVSVVIWVVLLVALQQQQQQQQQVPQHQVSDPSDHQRKLESYLETAQERIKQLEDQIVEFQKRNVKKQRPQPPMDIDISKFAQQHEFRQVQEELQQCKEQKEQQSSDQQSQQQSSSTSSIPSILSRRPFASENPVCQLFPYPIPHAASLWTQHLNRIHKASQLSNDHRFYFSDFSALLLHLVSPRLPHSVKTTPRASWPKVDEILRVAHERYQYITTTNKREWRKENPHKSIPRPVKVLIMGGSLLVGMNCRKIIRDLGFQMRLPLGDCAWANRLEKLLNQFLLPNKQDGTNTPTLLSWGAGREGQIDTHYIIQVTKIAMGGTNTQQGTTILEYDLIPDDAKNPDIIINAYATNDMHIITMLEAQSGNATLRDKVFDMTQEFVRRVMTPPPPHCNNNNHNNNEHQRTQTLPPLMIHMDDYLGNEQREIWATTELAQGVQVLANYYGFASVSYSDVVREFVYGDTHEYWFSPEGWYDAENGGVFSREIHPNMGMHMVAAWVMAYNFLNMITTFCSLEGWNLHHDTHFDGKNNINKRNGKEQYQPLEYTNTNLNNLPHLTGYYVPLGKPKPHPSGLPPALTKTLSLEHVTQMWEQQHGTTSSTSSSPPPPYCTNHSGGVKCPFSWLSGISNDIQKPEELEAYFEKYTKIQRNNNNNKDDWKFQDDHHKLGIVPHATMSPLTLDLERVAQPIRKVTIFYMKSYGPKWDDSKLQAQIYKKKSHTGNDDDNNMELLYEREFVSHHDKHTSETYQESFDLSRNPVETGATLRIRLTLLEGATSKVMGFAMCS